MTDVRTHALPAPAPAIPRPGAPGLARAECTVATPLTSSVTDLPGSIVTFEVPEDRDVWVVGRVPNVAPPRRGSAVVQLTDGEGRVVDHVEVRRRRGPGVGDVALHELVPAGSGAVTRKLRARTTRGRGAANQDGAGLVTLDAALR